jgi:PIN domain nuclease of toxin-antitoxin system
MKLLLDTCCLIWSVGMPDRLSENARNLIVQPDTEVCVSAISCAEVACAARRGLIILDSHWKKWFRHHVAANEWSVLDITLDIVEESYSLPDPFHDDPADRIIVATARLHECQLLTADSKILQYPHVHSAW